jgi:tetraacyldisaccharide 4'-kinase
VIITRVEQADPVAVAAVEGRVRERGGPPLFRAHVVPGCVIDVAVGREEGLARLRGARVVAVAGVGRFESFTRLVETAGARVVDTVRYQDHHPYQRADWERVAARGRELGADAIVTTEKDAVKLERFDLTSIPLWAIRIGVRIEPEGRWNALLDRLAAQAAGRV